MEQILESTKLHQTAIDEGDEVRIEKVGTVAGVGLSYISLIKEWVFMIA